MDILSALLNFIRDPTVIIEGWIATLGMWAYAPLFLVVFIETGIVIMPFLPGDSLLFAAGIFANGNGGLSLARLLLTVWCAAVLGDQCNYTIGRAFGKKIMASGKAKALTPERIAKTEALLEKYGPLAIFLGRFFPFIRTFVPFFAGMGGMRWQRFAPWNVLGGIVWSSVFVLLGYFFGGIPIVRDNFELVVVAIVAVSLVPAVGGAAAAWLKRRASCRRADPGKQ